MIHSRKIDQAVKMARAAFDTLLLTPAERVDAIARLASPDESDPRTRIDAALAVARGHVGNAATLLGYSRRGLQYRMRELGMPKLRNGAKHKSI